MIRNLLFALSLAIVAILPTRVFASHALGAEITYTNAGGNTYNIVYTFYRDCAGITPPTSIPVTITSSCGASVNATLTPGNGCTSGNGTPNGAQISGICAANALNTTCYGGTLPGTQAYSYCATVVLPYACSDWTISYSECCRNNAITNITSASGYELYVQATIDNSDPSIKNSSPIFTTDPSQIFCVGTFACYNHGAADIDGDSLAFSLVSPLDFGGNPITTYNNGLSATNPMATTGNNFTFDPLTGQMCFTPSGTQVDVITVQVDEWRKINGVPTKIGTTMRDIQFTIVNCNGQTLPPPTAQNASGGIVIPPAMNSTADSVVVCPDTPLSFTAKVNSSTTNTLTMTSNSGQTIPGSAFNISGNGTTSVTGTFNWTPGVADSGLHSFVVTVSDNNCPIPATVSRTFKVFVYGKPAIIASATAVCGDSVQLLATNASTVTWTPTTGLSCTTCVNPKVLINTPTTFTAHTNCGDASITVGVGTPFTLDAGKDTSLCLNGTTTLTSVTTGGVGPFTYQWSPATPASTISSPSIANPVVSPTTTTTFTLTATSSEGCVRTDSVKVAVSGVAPRVVVTADPAITCPGGKVQLTLTTLPAACGAAPAGGCNGNTATYTVGTGTAATPAQLFGEPAVYGTWYGSRKIQILYRASELAALGAGGGQINSMGFNVSSIPNGVPTTIKKFSISMKCVSNAALATNSFANNTGMTTVYPAANTTITTGWNTHTFSQPYMWDGTSNILVEICWDNGNNGSSNMRTLYTVTPYNSIIDYNLDYNEACPNPSTFISSATFTHRPNTRFNICAATLPTNTAINWTPTTGLNDATIANPIAQVFNTTTYIGNVTANGCTGSGFAVVTVQNNLTLTASNDTSICIAAPIPLTASVTGTAQPVMLNCGVNGTACGGASVLHTVGTAGTSTNLASPYLGADEEGHMQVLFLASELKSAGLTRGIIKDLAFNIANKVSTGPFQQFTIKMGCTSLTNLTSTFATGLATVYTPKSVTTAAGWNTYTLDNPYDWDGYSNVLVEVCFTNPAFAGTVGSDIVAATTTGFTSSNAFSQSFLSQGGCNITTGTTATLRPDMRLNICPPPAGNFYYHWKVIAGTGPGPFTGQNITVTPTADVTYQIEVTDSSCYAFDTVKIHFLNGYKGNLVGSNIGCNGTNTGDITATPTLGNPPYTFRWEDAAQQVLRTSTGTSDVLTGLGPGTYFLFMEDANHCQAKDSLTLTVPAALKVDRLDVTNVGCFGETNGAITATISGGTPFNRTLQYKYLWSTAPADTFPTLSNLGAGLYGLHIVDSTGCTLDTFASVTAPAQFLYDMDSTRIKCYGGATGTATINILSPVTGTLSYQWSNGQQGPIDTNLAVGTYVLTLTELPGGCKHVDSVVVTQNDSFIILISAVTPASCYNTPDGKAEASVGTDTTNYTFLWDNTETTAYAQHLAASPNPHQVVVTNNVGCPQYASALITAPQRFTLSTKLIDKISCYGDSNATAVVLVDNSVGGIAPFRYLWSNLQNHDTVIQLKGGQTYGVTVTDANGCPEYDSIVVTQPDSLHLVGGSIPATCYNGTDGGVFVKATGGTPPYFYDWSSGAQTDSVRNLAQGTYSVTVRDSKNCTKSIFNISVGQPPTPVGIKSTNIVNVSCPGNNDGGIFVVAQGGTPGYTYSLNGGAAQTDGNFNPLKPDSNYVLVITDTNNCKFTQTLIVTEPDSFSVVFVPATDTINLGDSILLLPKIEPLTATGDKFTWSPSFSLNCDTCPSAIAKPLITTVYELTLSRSTQTSECSRSARVEVVVLNDKILYVPNAFSPNGDGYNDFFDVHAVGGKSMKMRVFDRWGTVIYDWDGDMTGKWDGNFNGEALPPSVYVYYIEVTYLDQQVRTNKGSVSIIK